MNLNILEIPNYQIKFRDKSPAEFTNAKFFKVIFIGESQVKKHNFLNLYSLVENSKENEIAYNFIEYQNDSFADFMFIEINYDLKIITLFKFFHPLPNRWSIFCNSKNNIKVRDLFDNKVLGNNKYYPNVDFYVGLSSLVEVIKNTKCKDIEEIIPLFNAERERLLNSNIIEYSDTTELLNSNLDIENNYLNHLIGLDNVKKEILALNALASIRVMKINRNIPVSATSLHMIFSGNPGTGKTSVARLIGKIYKNIGLLKNGHLIEVTSGELEAMYVGHSAPLTKEYFEKAINGVLFIDEAYSLFKSGNNFGTEVIDTLVKLMEDNRENIVVIIAGYPDEMQKLLDSNKGFRDRFSKLINFNDYTKSELKEILLQMVFEMKHTLTNGACYKFEYLLDEYFGKGYFKSNARTIRNIFEQMQINQSIRLSKIANPTDIELLTFTETDLPDTL